MAHFKNHRKDQPKSNGWHPAPLPVMEQNDVVLRAIYAPRSERNSRPCSDLAMLTDKSVNPEYAQWAQNRLQRPLTPSHSVPLTEPNAADIALDTTQRNFESDEDYANRMKEIVSSESKKNSKKE